MPFFKNRGIYIVVEMHGGALGASQKGIYIVVEMHGFLWVGGEGLRGRGLI